MNLPVYRRESIRGFKRATSSLRGIENGEFIRGLAKFPPSAVGVKSDADFFGGGGAGATRKDIVIVTLDYM